MNTKDILDRELREGRFDENTVYAVHRGYLDHFNKFAAKTTCGRVSDYSVCISTQRHDALREFLEEQQAE
jgi:hypothetical protein